MASGEVSFMSSQRTTWIYVEGPIDPDTGTPVWDYWYSLDG